MKQQEVAIYGPVFTTLTHRSSNPSQPTLRLYAYKHHIQSNVKGESQIIFDLNQKSELVQDFTDPIAKIDWRNGTVKVLNKQTWEYLPYYAKDCIAQDFYEFWLHSQP